jgi:cell wall-associated NlpC family hydrolase
LIRSSAGRYGVPADLLASLLRAESSFNPQATSGAGAQGIAQFMPGTWSGSWNPYRSQSPFSTQAAIPAAALYLSRALKTNHGDVSLALASYNAGQGAVNRYHGIPPYQETQNYVKRILGYRADFPGLAHGGAPAAPSGQAPGGTTPPAAATPGLPAGQTQTSAPITIANPAYQQTVGIQNLIQQNAQNAKIPSLSIPLPAQTITQPGQPVTPPAPTATPKPGSDTTVHLALPTPSHVTGHEARVVDLARQYLGTPYVWGGTTPKGFDCSGFAQFLYKRIGVNLPRTSQEQFKTGTPISIQQLQPGDLVFFKGTDGPANDVGHEGIYLGGGKFIHAPHTGDVVKISSLSDSYYQQHYAGGRRVG